MVPTRLAVRRRGVLWLHRMGLGGCPLVPYDEADHVGAAYVDWLRSEGRPDTVENWDYFTHPGFSDAEEAKYGHTGRPIQFVAGPISETSPYPMPGCKPKEAPKAAPCDRSRNDAKRPNALECPLGGLVAGVCGITLTPEERRAIEEAKARFPYGVLCLIETYGDRGTIYADLGGYRVTHAALGLWLGRMFERGQVVILLPRIPNVIHRTGRL